ncbi:MAG: hypothetical protein JSV56_11845 [Methanomassiliicoccales archaeon]|nr:MAG: hypothetical protein JSV56_11845 [Methanomassiliicoccales archaeon]
MKRNLFSLFHIFICLFIVLSLVITLGCARRPPTLSMQLTNKKVIVSHIGEVIHDTRYVDDSIRYRIYYVNNLNQNNDLTIIDELDAHLSIVKVFNNGKYDKQSHMVIWEIKNVAAGQGGFVEFEAIVGKAELIRNKAVIQTQDRQDIQTNTVETAVLHRSNIGWIPFETGSIPGDEPRSYMKDETTMGMMINFDIPGMFVQEVKVDGVTYHRLSIPGYATNFDLGNPELPILGQTLEVPYGVNFNVEIVKSKSVPLQGYNILPAQEIEIPFDRIQQKNFALNKATYLTNAKYPPESTFITADDIAVIRGHRLAFLKVNPIRYNPLTKEITAFSNIEVRLKYDHPAQIQRIDKRLESMAFEGLLRSAVLNYKSSGRMTQYDSPGDWTEGADYLIITHGRFYKKNDPTNPIVRFRNWKQQKGLKTKVVDIANIGKGTASDIKNFIQTAYDTWKPVPTYILLVGDAGDDTGKVLIPTNYETVHPYSKYHFGTKTGTDLYYTTVDGDDYFQDIYIGRLPNDTLEEARIVINKILDYERKPPTQSDYYKNGTLVSVFEDRKKSKNQEGSDGQEDQYFIFIEVMEEVYQFLKNKGYNPQRIYTKLGTYKDGPKKYENGTSIPKYLQMPQFAWDGTTKKLADAVNNGTFILHFLTHGGRGGIGPPTFLRNHVQGLKNGALTPVLFAHACAISWFDNETDNDGPVPIDWRTDNKLECLGEHFLRHDKGGAVAIMGATRVSSTLISYLTLGVYEALWPEFKPNPPISKDPMATGELPNVQMGPLVRIGQINTFSKVYMANYISKYDKYRKTEFEMSHVFGDPEMPVWTKMPATLKVQHPKGIGSIDTQDFVIKVMDNSSKKAVQIAVVGLTRGDKILDSKQTNLGGIARFTLYSPGIGDINITVTAHNYRPYISQIMVSAGGAVLNRLAPEDGVENTEVHVGGIKFIGTQKVTISFDGKDKLTTQTKNGSFGQPGAADVKFKVPSPYPLGPVNILTHGQNPDLYAIDVFHVRSANPVDLYTYSQKDSSTWHLHSSGDNPTWDNPEIQLYESNKPVDSNNLKTSGIYTIKANIYNRSKYAAKNVRVTFKWADYGVGQPLWNAIKTVTLDVSANSKSVAELSGWTPPRTGHVCIIAEIYHIEDIKTSDNIGQENLHIGPSSSPAQVRFLVYNPTNKPASVNLELRQFIKSGQEEEEKLWPSWIRHPDPQVIPPGDSREAWVIIDPPPDVPSGQQAEFALTAFIDRQVIGGINFIIIKK